MGLRTTYESSVNPQCAELPRRMQGMINEADRSASRSFPTNLSALMNERGYERQEKGEPLFSVPCKAMPWSCVGRLTR